MRIYIYIYVYTYNYIILCICIHIQWDATFKRNGTLDVGLQSWVTGMLMGDSKRYIEWEINNNIIKGVSISHQYPINIP